MARGREEERAKMRGTLVLGFVMLVCGCSDVLSTDEIREQEEATVVGWSADGVVVGAVQAQNGQGLTLAEIQRRDAGWVAGTEAALSTATTTGACADRLRAFAAMGSQYGEILLMDNQGALVCASVKPSDYWQGDEPKWIRAFNGGAGATFMDEARYDESSKQTLAQLSVPVRSAGTVIGVLTVGVRADR
jgi:hypothetical protein